MITIFMILSGALVGILATYLQCDGKWFVFYFLGLVIGSIYTHFKD